MRKQYNGDVLIMSIKPKYAQAILNGTKTVEIRRRKIKLPNSIMHSRILIYETAPTKKFVGIAKIGHEIHGHPLSIRIFAEKEGAISREEYDKYMEGAQIGTVFFIADVYRFDEPIKPPEGWRSPQSYYRTTTHECRALIKTRPPAI